MRVESRSVSSGLNPHVSAENRSSVPAVNFGSIHGTVGRAAVGSQSAVPPAPSMSSEWWENVDSEKTLIPGADITDIGEKLGRGPFKFPKALAFDGSDASYPSWLQNFLLSARPNSLIRRLFSRLRFRLQTSVLT